jgi:hypothetical protein
MDLKRNEAPVRARAEVGVAAYFIRYSACGVPSGDSSYDAQAAQLIIIPRALCALPQVSAEDTLTSVDYRQGRGIEPTLLTWVAVMPSTAYVVSGPLTRVRASQLAGCTAIRPLLAPPNR